MKLTQYPVSRPTGPDRPLWRSRRARQSAGRGHRSLALAGMALVMAAGGVAAAAPAQASDPVLLDPLVVQRACKSPGNSGDVRNAYYTSVVLRGSDSGSSTFTFDSMTVQQNPALTDITPKQVTVPARSTTTVTLQVAGSPRSADGPGVLSATVDQGGTSRTHSSTIGTIVPMQSPDCGVTYPSSATKPWPVTSSRVAAFDSGGGQGYVPPAAQSGVTAVAQGTGYQLAVKTDGTVVGWGDDTYGAVTPPAGLTGVKAVAAGYDYSLALKTDGSVVGWGQDRPAMTDMATRTGLVSISGGWYWSVGLTSQGGVVAAGQTGQGGDAWVPAGLDHGVTQVVAGSESAVALKSDGNVVAWDSGNTVRPVPADVHDVVAVATSSYGWHGALKADGTVVVWNDGGFVTTLATKGTRIAMGGYGDSVVYVQQQDGTVVVIRPQDGIPVPVPAATGATALATQGDNGLALVPSA